MKRFACLLLVIAILMSFASALAQETATDAALDPEAVRELQINLIGAGYLKGEADGVMGPSTLEAIRTAQEALGLPVTGAMSDELNQALVVNSFPLREGNRNGLVYDVQRRLSDWGFLEEEPDGSFGKTTLGAVIMFQEYYHAAATNYMQANSDAAIAAMEVSADVILDQPLYNEVTVPCDGVVTEDWYNFMFSDACTLTLPTVALQDQGAGVKQIQNRLHLLGYLYSGMDGVYGSGSELALKYFQRRNNLPETGVCDRYTAEALFSNTCVRSDEYVMPYSAYVDRAKSRVYILGWDGSGYNTKVKTFKCSCGKKSTPTIKGTYYCVGPISEWYFMSSSNVWVRYAFQIQGNYFFHSVLYKYKGAKNPTPASVYNLGTNVSHGCIRLAVDDVKWIYENCTKGMKVEIV